ncbi:MAG: CD0415/CD1112 family protein [Anaerovoracaceae bacterium]
MDFLTDWITEWLKGLLVDGIIGNLSGLFDNVNNQVGEIATQVGTSPAAWNAGVFSLIRQLSETVVLPIAGMVLTFVMCYELIQMIVDRNNLHDIDTWMFFKWVFKTFVAVMILSNTFNIVMAVFDVAQSVVNSAGGLISGSTAVTSGMMDTLEAELTAMDLGPLLGLFLQSFMIQIIVLAMNIVVFVIVYGRMIEIYLLTSLAPIPMATVVNREIGSMGHNYFRSLLAVAFQGFLILVCVAIYAVLVQSIAIGGDPIGAIWSCIGYTVLLCFTLFKTGSLSKSIFGAH